MSSAGLDCAITVPTLVMWAWAVLASNIAGIPLFLFQRPKILSVTFYVLLSVAPHPLPPKKKAALGLVSAFRRSPGLGDSGPAW